jgi:hypothetical protein
MYAIVYFIFVGPPSKIPIFILPVPTASCSLLLCSCISGILANSALLPSSRYPHSQYGDLMMPNCNVHVPYRACFVAAI